ncbi:PIN domain-containing protein [Rathayibacter soli]|uniref:PIN domain-containing protein n=1 Tax=Rathayibacter soli TaxID=3144168 RepID=UPI0027E440B3|nr:PIN domain-containing protein [Glaciibacter superstes]
MSSPIALDTSVAVPLLVRNHTAHARIVQWWDGRELSLSGHALAETYSVLTRLPGDARLAPTDAARLLATRFSSPLVLKTKTAGHLVEVLAALAIAGGAVYDAMVALAALENDFTLATRDARAKSTYEAVGVRFEIVG